MADRREQAEQREKQVHELQTQISFLEEEVGLLRRRLTNAPRQVQLLEEKLVETREALARATGQNEKLADALRDEKQRIEALAEEVEKLSQPPATFGVFIGSNDDGSVDVVTAGRKLRVMPAPDLEADKLVSGAQVILNDALNVVEVLDPDGTGQVVKVKDKLGSDRAVVVSRGDEEHVAYLAGSLLGTVVRAGDPVLYDARSGVATELLPREEVEELVLEEIPDITYEDIGGLEGQIEAIRDAVELPFLYAELFQEHQLEAPKGVLLYGPPGCGKTLIAKAVAKSLADKVRERTGREDARSYFLNVKGPELLNKYVGETERQIREIFQRAKERSEEGLPVIVFFDEMDSIFRTRGTGISSDVESTIVPQLLSELDGVETLKNVIVIGASNREDLIDPAILRPGPPRREDQDRATDRRAGQGRHVEVSASRGADPSGRGRPALGRCPGGRRPDDRANRRADVRALGAQPVPRGHVRVRRQGDPLLQGLQLGGDDREHRPTREERRHQAIPVQGRERHQDRGPPDGDPGRVQGERRPPEHHQPRRLGEDLGQEGRADRLRPHPAR